MASFIKLHETILRSTIWSAPDHVRIVWITMMALTNRDGIVEGSVPGLAHQARVDLNQCEQALELLSAPDTHSRTKEHEGRRIVEVDGGWRLLNYDKYRHLMSDEDRREKDAARKRKARALAKARASAASADVPDVTPGPHKGEGEGDVEDLKPKSGGGTAPPLLSNSEDRRCRWVVRDHVNRAAPPRPREDVLGERIRFDDWFPSQQLMDWCRAKQLTDAEFEDALTELRNKIGKTRLGDVGFWDLKAGRYMVVAIEQKERGGQNGKGGARQPDRGNVDADEFTRTT